METPEQTDRLSEIHTRWTLVRHAHAGEAGVVRRAQQEMLERYLPAMERYLHAAVGDPHAVAELCQEFVLRFLQGKLHQADPSNGRFRSFLKAALLNLVRNYERGRRRRGRQCDVDELDAATHAEPGGEAEQALREAWRERLLAAGWEGLDREQGRTGRPVARVLRCQAEHPEWNSARLAEHLAALTGEAWSAERVRKWRAVARASFADVVVGEVAQTLDRPSQDGLAEELRELGLLELCEEALVRRGESIFS